MDLATAQKPTYSFVRIVSYLMLLPGIILTFWVVFQFSYTFIMRSGEFGVAKTGIINQWKYMRNICYQLFIVYFILVGTVNSLGYSRVSKTDSNLKTTIVPAIIGLIFLTFSYALGALLADLGIAVSLLFRLI